MVEKVNTLPANRYKVVQIEQPTTEVLNELTGTDYTIISINPSLSGSFYYVTMEYDPVYGSDGMGVYLVSDDDDEYDGPSENVLLKKGQH